MCGDTLALVDMGGSACLTSPNVTWPCLRQDSTPLWCATSLKKSPVNCDPGCPTSELCSAPEPLVTPVCF